jgi:ABC-type Zn uptake system ZnuABC Zn-binding protein ZnuA
VVEAMKARSVPAVLRAVFNPRAVPEGVAAETGAKVIVLEHMPGALGTEEDYLGFVDGNVKALAAVLGKGKR